jgi:hypothetical protein
MIGPLHLVLPDQAARNKVWASYRVKRHRYEWKLSRDEFEGIVIRDCIYCGSPPANVVRTTRTEFTYSGIDRIDSSRGYIPGNVVPCCQWCNKSKLDRSVEDFLNHCKQVSMHQESIQCE